MEIFVDLLFAPLFGILEAVAGLLWPSKDPAVRRLQCICAVLLFCGLVVFASGLSVAYLLHSWRALPLIAIAALLFIASGILGNRIERKCKVERSDHSDVSGQPD
jgi:hypothetical protein